MQILLLNPNTSIVASRAMNRIAADTAGAATVTTITAINGPETITDEPALAAASGEVARMVASIAPNQADAVVIAAFGDPGLAAARRALPIPVTGLAAASLAEAAADGRRFAIATTTPGLDAAIRHLVVEAGVSGRFAGTYFTRSGIAAMADPARLVDELAEACHRAVVDGAAAVVIGGGPLATAARALRPLVPTTLIEPVPAAIRAVLAWKAAEGGTTFPP